MSRVIVTGASGFVGRAVRAAVPAAEALSLSGTDWRAKLAGADLRGSSILHLGARAHAGRGVGDPEFVDAAEKARALGDAAARAGARVLVFASSIKVNGEESASRPIAPQDTPHPEDPYARSKLAVEQVLREISASTGLPVHIVRPPLVYGPHARGNLATLLRWCDSPWPLPFAAVENRRSFVALADLVALLVKCIEQPMPDAPVWLAAHPSPISTRQLITEARAALGRPARLYGVSQSMLEGVASLAGARALMRRLTRSLEVDAAATRAAFDWQPRIDPISAIREMASAFR